MKSKAIGASREGAEKLAVVKRRLKHESNQRHLIETSLKTRELHYTELLTQSRQMQEDLRQMTHRIWTAQEADRKSISHELQNEVAQTLLSINIRLISMKKEARSKTKGLKSGITNTQQMLSESMKAVQRIARELKNA